jgi:hypothetical protein
VVAVREDQALEVVRQELLTEAVVVAVVDGHLQELAALEEMAVQA